MSAPYYNLKGRRCAKKQKRTIMRLEEKVAVFGLTFFLEA